MTNLNLRYETRLPQVGTPPYPALVLLHGRGANEWDLMPLANHLDPRFLVLSVRAPWRLDDGWEWYRMQDTLAPPDARSFEQSIAALQGLLHDLAGALPLDVKRCFGLGFSQGALMLGAALLRMPRYFRGVALLSGYLPTSVIPSDADATGARCWIGHGSHDPVVPVALARAERDALEALGATVTYHEYAMAHQITLEELQAVNGWFQLGLHENNDGA